MKIISKYKDFYDFLVWKYGEDEKIIFNRDVDIIPEKLFFPDVNEENESEFFYSDKNFLKKKCRETLDENNFCVHSILVIGDEILHIFVGKDAIYTHFDIISEKNIKKYYKKFIFRDKKEFFIYSCFQKWLQNGELDWWMVFDLKNLQIERNDVKFVTIFWKNISEIPILLAEQTDFSDGFCFEKNVYKNPILSKLGIFLKPEWVWQNIYNFLLRIQTEKEYYHEAKNDEKIINKWFSLKTSFRPQIKKK